ncbi:MAG: GIY-YIG nuclease family protein [Candidatus Omnitrophica bacterium]|nr:GIY-YIG nuclease family protein [Candidatus Omnitrophota bacterium]
MIDKRGYVYILTNKNDKVLYVGITSDLVKRVYEHKTGLVEGFTRKYKTHKLVYYETFEDIVNAITREKQIKGWLRRKKVELIEKFNPGWIDLYKSIL